MYRRKVSRLQIWERDRTATTYMNLSRELFDKIGALTPGRTKEKQCQDTEHVGTVEPFPSEKSTLVGSGTVKTGVLLISVRAIATLTPDGHSYSALKHRLSRKATGYCPLDSTINPISILIIRTWWQVPQAFLSRSVFSVLCGEDRVQESSARLRPTEEESPDLRRGRLFRPRLR